MTKKKAYKFLFFDLDHTLWDFDKNSTETLWQLFYEYELDIKLRTKPENFIVQYQKVNRALWKAYESHELTKEELRWKRFELSMNAFGYSNPELSKELCITYLKICPHKTNLIPHCSKLLEYLWDSGKYKMAIITNGFAEIQHHKISKSGIEKYFSHTIISELTGYRKPHGHVFKYALDQLGAIRKHSLMIGDSFHSDIIGAKRFGIDQVYYNPMGEKQDQEATYEIKCLSELLNLL